MPSFLEAKLLAAPLQTVDQDVLSVLALAYWRGGNGSGGKVGVVSFTLRLGIRSR